MSGDPHYVFGSEKQFPGRDMDHKTIFKLGIVGCLQSFCAQICKNMLRNELAKPELYTETFIMYENMSEILFFHHCMN